MEGVCRGPEQSPPGHSHKPTREDHPSTPAGVHGTHRVVGTFRGENPDWVDTGLGHREVTRVGFGAFFF